ncbi:archease [Streptomyces sp. WMMB 322]|uniref:archease n=1 Tax=Streptomyces sp. WMMB 322 TaxID=1286821 RepID=UPI0006E2EB05|nr:archease [Streptomyces sp. WMMB 322]SCK43713.1 SHS2 domain-containing protein [Streptomyces sp. WMMB 322]
MVSPGSAEGRGGHRTVPHTADLRVEAWGPTREECLAHAVRGVCESFLDVRGTAPVRKREVTVRPETDEDLLRTLLEELVYRLDTDGEIPVQMTLTQVPGGLRAALHMAEVAPLPVTGAAPKAVTLHELVFRRGPHGWICSVTLDV